MDNTDLAKKAAFRLLSFRPRSENELRNRLQKKNFSREDVESVIQYLRMQKFLDDERFAKLIALSGIQSRGVGKNHIRRDLARKGLSASQISGAMKEIEGVDEFESAIKLAQRWIERMSGLSLATQRRRLHGMLFRRGFSNDVVFKVLGQILKNNAQDDFHESI